MLDAASAGGYALAAVNVTSSETLNGAMRGFAEAGADGIVQVTTGGAEFASGGAVRDMALGPARWPSTPACWASGTRSRSRCTPTTRRATAPSPSCAL
jgi:fructose/tagatose bisphosphate aldolase